jgi:NADH:ubiquinone oxidoreductase subunit 2 (subunit N)
MIFFNNSLDTLVILFIYMFVYNVSLIIIFWTLLQFISFNFKTIYSFTDLKFNFYFVTILSIVLFSIAGVPPFLGFFSKLLILILLINSSFFFFYIFFFGLLFFGLYFYLQNIRFLYSTGIGKLNYSYSNNLRISSLYYYITFFFIFFLIFGFAFMDDLILYFYWIFS